MDRATAFLLDLDDTILDDVVNSEACWREACQAHASRLPGTTPDLVHQAIEKTRAWFWADDERHRRGRLDLDAASREVAGLALKDVGIDDRSLAADIAARYRQMRLEGLRALPGAIETVRWLRGQGNRLALLTNGNGALQRMKVERFGLAELFDSVLIEGELGYGKPDPRIYEQALRDLGAAPADAWMVGDNLEWDVVQPQRMGMSAAWVDVYGTGLPESSTARPDRIIRTLADLRDRG